MKNIMKMENKNELIKTDIKNRTCYYFDDIVIVIDIDFDTLLDKKSYKTQKNILVFDISYKTFIGAKPLRISFDEIEGFIKIYDRTRYLILFGPEQYGTIYNRIRYFIS